MCFSYSRTISLQRCDYVGDMLKKSVLIVCLALLNFTPLARANPLLRPVVVSGDPSSIGGGVKFATFGSPVISDDGRVVFTSTLSGGSVSVNNDNGLFISSGSSYSTPLLVAREGSPTPFGGKTYGNDFLDPVLRGARWPLVTAPLPRRGVHFYSPAR